MKLKPNPDIREQVLAALLAGKTTEEVATEFDLRPEQVRQWKMAFYRENPELRPDVGALLYGYLEHALEAQFEQLKVFGDPIWLRGQSAADLAVLHAAINDKTMRLIEAAERARLKAPDEPKLLEE